MPRKVPTRRSIKLQPEEETVEAPPVEPIAPKEPSKLNRGYAFLLVVILLTAGVLLVKNTFAKPKVDPSARGLSGTEKTSEAGDANTVVAQIAKHIKILSEETPAVATVNDPDTLRQNNPAFYKYAKQGDMLVVWSDKAVLYSPSEDILLAVQPVTVGSQAKTSQTAPTSDEKEVAKIEVRNGSGITGLGKTVATRLSALGLDVMPATDAKLHDYAKTSVFVKPGATYPKTLQAILSATNGVQIEVLPAEEGKMRGDILVIIGKE